MADLRPDLLRAVLDRALTPAVVCEEHAAWWSASASLRAQGRVPIERAVLGGVMADRLGWAFASGYQAALRALDPDLPADLPASLCVTEAGGNHPRAIETRLSVDAAGVCRLDGTKRWASLAGSSGVLLVAASVGTDDVGRNRLAVARLRAETSGVRVTIQPPTPFVPEVPHASLRFEQAPCTRLAGDGWTDWVKPFRTIEDLYVSAATTAWLLGVAVRHRWPDSVISRLTAQLYSWVALSSADPRVATAHLAIGGLFLQQAALLEAVTPHWERVPAALASRWRRDRALLGVAGKARARRLEAALDVLLPDRPSEPDP